MTYPQNSPQYTKIKETDTEVHYIIYGQFQNCNVLALVVWGDLTVIIRLYLSFQLNFRRNCQLELSLAITLQVEVVNITSFIKSFIHFLTTASGTAERWVPSTAILPLSKAFLRTTEHQTGLF